MLDARVLSAGQRMSTDEPRVVVSGDHLALGRADVGDHAIRGRRGERLADQLRQPADGHGDEHGLGLGDGGGYGAAGAVQRAELERALQRLGRVVVAGHLGAESLARREGHRAADQSDAENREPHPQARRLGRLAASAHRVCQTVEHLDGGVPADAAVGDRLAVDKVALPVQVLAPVPQE